MLDFSSGLDTPLLGADEDDVSDKVLTVTCGVRAATDDIVFGVEVAGSKLLLLLVLLLLADTFGGELDSVEELCTPPFCCLSNEWLPFSAAVIREVSVIVSS